MRIQFPQCTAGGLGLEYSPCPEFRCPQASGPFNYYFFSFLDVFETSKLDRRKIIFGISSFTVFQYDGGNSAPSRDPSQYPLYLKCYSSYQFANIPIGECSSPLCMQSAPEELGRLVQDVQFLGSPVKHLAYCRPAFPYAAMCARSPDVSRVGLYDLSCQPWAY